MGTWGLWQFGIAFPEGNITTFKEMNGTLFLVRGNAGEKQNEYFS